MTIVQPSGRGNMGMKRRLPLMLNDAPSASKSRKTTSSLEIQSLADSEYDDDDDDDEYVNLMGGLEQPIVFQQANMVPASSSTRGMISEIPNTPSSTRSHHDELEDIDDIIEEVGGKRIKVENLQVILHLRSNPQEAPEEDVNKIFEELSEATSTATTPAQVVSANGGGSASAVAVSVAPPPQVSGDNVAANQEFLRIEDPAATSSASRVADQSKGIEQPKKTWYANKDGFISAEIPTDLFDEQSQSSTAGALVDANVNPTLSEDLTMKIKQEADETKKPKKFNGAHLQLARLPSNTGDVFSLSTPEDFTMHLENVQSDLNTLKGLLATNDQYSYDPSHLAGVSGMGDNLVVSKVKVLQRTNRGGRFYLCLTHFLFLNYVRDVGANAADWWTIAYRIAEFQSELVDGRRRICAGQGGFEFFILIFFSRLTRRILFSISDHFEFRLFPFRCLTTRIF